MSKEISYRHDKRLANLLLRSNYLWRERTGFDNIMTAGELRERKRQERIRQRRQNIGLSE